MTEVKRKREKVRKYVYRGIEEEKVLDMKDEEVIELFTSRVRRRFDRLSKRSNKVKSPYLKVAQRVEKSKLNLQPGEKPKLIKTRLRNGVIMPCMVGGILGVYNGKEYFPVEVKFEMIGRYFAEFAISYKHTKHGKTGKGATKSSKHVDKT